MTNLLFILLAIVMLGFIILMHELGHYCVARLTGIGVEEFSIGFGPKLLKWRRKGIDYSLRLLPLGGYVRFVGEDEDNASPDAFNAQPVWKRLLTVFSGPFMNFVLAYLIFVVLLMGFGISTKTALVGSIMKDMPAERAGLKVGDRIVAIDGQAIGWGAEEAQRLLDLVGATPDGESTTLLVERGAEQFEVTLTPQRDESGRQLIGIYLGTERYYPPLGEAMASGGTGLWNLLTQMLDMFRDLIFHGTGAGDVMGPVGTIGFVSQEVRQGMESVLLLIIIISLNLGIINLLPLPALDGGRLVFLVVEGIRRKPIDRNKEAMVHFIGLVLFMGLFVLVTYQDILRLIRG